ncbi:protein subunit release factor B [Xanthomonas euvesicatoria]|uniref:Protein subunit release factor B n=1 Tax=Xanthomonas euvesicatoria TaxID=456327 RepID=A0AAW3TXT7_XANEU|nr:protein subunit release factor B [Xanthomonas euvesicatoria]MBB4868300.1 protein subunit release factor B [Xanthomonas euvesicatoria]
MTATNHYRDQIQRATERLAQLQAKELLANQRREAKAQETAKREEIKDGSAWRTSWFPLVRTCWTTQNWKRCLAAT